METQGGYILAGRFGGLKMKLLFALTALVPFAFAQNSGASDQFIETFEPTAPTNNTLTRKQLVDIGINAIAKRLNVPVTEIKARSHHNDIAGITHVYVDRVISGIVVRNQEASAHIKNAQVIALTGSTMSQSSSSTAGSQTQFIADESDPNVISPEAAQNIAANRFKLQPVGTPELVLMHHKKGGLIKVYEVKLMDEHNDIVKVISIDCKTGKIVFENKLSKGFTYKAIPLPNENPTAIRKIVNPENKIASRLGWSSADSTSGNNVIAKVWSTNYELKQVNGVFAGAFKATEEPTTLSNIKAALANAFYVVNLMHDITYQYGFDEEAGNFQQNNFNKGGLGGDPIEVSIQDGRNNNNAEFIVSPDGTTGKLNLGIFALTSPKRDGALDNGIIVHEYAHGVTGRLSGGRRTVQCMNGAAPDALDEGWADSFSFMLSTKPTDTRARNYGPGTYILNRPSGVRKYLYSTSLSTNPLKCINI